MKNNNTTSIFARFSQAAAIPGNKAAIVRLCLVAVTLVGGLLLTLLALPPITDGFGNFLTAIFTGIFCSIMAAALLWGFARWARFIFPKALAGAKRFWNSLYALSIFALVIKVMVWIYLLMLPVVLYGIVLAPLYFVVFALSLMGSEVLAVLILALLLVGSLFMMVLLDVCKLKNLCWKQTLRAMFCHARQTVTAATRKAVAVKER